MADISALLANAAQTNADFDLGKLNKSYWEGRDQFAKNDLRDAFKDGLPMAGGQPDYLSMVKTLIQKGALDQGLAVAKLAQDQQDVANSQRVSVGLNGGQPLPPSSSRQNGVADSAFRRDTSTDQPAPGATPLPPDQRQDPQSDVYRMPQQQAVEAWRDSVRPAVGGAQPLQPQAQPMVPTPVQTQVVRPPAQVAPPPQQVAQAPQAAPPTNFQDRYSAIRPGQGDDPTLGGLIPPGFDAPSYIRRLNQAIDTTRLPAAQVKNYMEQRDAIYKALASDRADEATTARQELGDRNKTQLKILENTIIPRIDKSKEGADAARNDIDSIHQSRAELDRKGGIFSGAWAEDKLYYAKVAKALNIANSDKIANTEAFQAAIGSRVKEMVKAFGSGNGISNADRDYSEKISGGNFKLDDKSIRRILDIAEKTDRNKIDRHNSDVEQFVSANEGLKPARNTFVVKQPGIYVKPLNEDATPKTAPQIGEIRTNAHGKQGRWNGSGYEVIR